ncbi:MAG: DUF4270 family protein [Ignavibacteriales bacterium]|nr:DUF4270 family protein [Ignavibacteriales bacterium]
MSVNKKSFGISRVRSALLIIFSFGLFFTACKENSTEFTLGEKYIESQTNLTLIDTFSVSLSTVIQDTLVTSGTGSMLIGNYSDAVFGKVTCSSYSQIGIPDNSGSIDNDDVYDSLSLVISYNKYFYGDTTGSQKISVHQLTEKIKLDDNDVITSGTEFNCDAEPIGSIIYTPQPNNTIDTLTIRISDRIGLDLFDKLKSKSEFIADDESFINYFHGLVLKADDSYEGSIIGFSAADLKLVLYTSRYEETDVEEINYEFPLNNSVKQFNNIKHDFSSTQLNSLVEQRSEQSSDKTEGHSFLQGGVGLFVKVKFPTLPEIFLKERGTIMKAQLLLAPLKGSYDSFDLPTDLILYKSDKLNQRTYAHSTSTLNVDELYHEETNYTFDITSYLTNEFADNYIDPGQGLLIMLPNDEHHKTLERLILDSKNQNTKLKIYYLSY